MDRSFVIFLLALALLCLTAPLGATVIYVSGEQTGTWAADTVIVTAEVRVPPGQSLNILPGVEVLFSAYCKLIVNNGATLRAVGIASDSIRFDILPPDTAWHGIRFLSASDSSILEYCHLTHGAATGSGADQYGGAIYCSDSNPTISYNTISGNFADYGGGIFCTYSNPGIIGNTISGNSGGYNGGAIYCTSGSPTISGNTISGNSAGELGGGIYCGNSSPTITGNTISGNSAGELGGGIYSSESNPEIVGNIILENEVELKGGGICCMQSSPNIVNNQITDNFSWESGGGIFCEGSNEATIEGNEIYENSAYFWGGGLSCESATMTMIYNTFGANEALEAYGAGGGIYLSNSAIRLLKCTVEDNYAWLGGGILSGSLCNLILDNCIVWANSGVQDPQICAMSMIQVWYSDVQGSWPGTGNINADPLFVNTAQNDCRLQWGSPCIDTGDLNPIYNDPDGTRADMGAWYYDQSLPVRILLTPYNAPIQIPPEGGSFQYAIQATNIESATLTTLIWCDVTLPDSSIYGPVLGPATINLASGQTLSRVRMQAVPAAAPAGMYHYNGYAVAEGDTSEDIFTFVKLGGGGSHLRVLADTPALQYSGWTNTGEEFALLPSVGFGESDLPRTFGISVSPNPFNPTTTLTFTLPAASAVRLEVFDVSGRNVGAHGCAPLSGSLYSSGVHQITFDGSSLPSGVYYYRLTAGTDVASGKMVLMK